MLPKTLNDLFAEYREDDYCLYVTKADDTTDDFYVHFALDVQDINGKGAIFQKWRIKAEGFKSCRVSFDLTTNIEIKDDHPLLWKFTDIQSQLYFSGQCKEPLKLFYDLYLIHKRLFGNYQLLDIPFEEGANYFNRFQYSNGLLTQGPKKLMILYADCLMKNGLEFTIIDDLPSDLKEDDSRLFKGRSLKALFIGDTYVVANDFSFVQE